MVTLLSAVLTKESTKAFKNRKVNSREGKQLTTCSLLPTFATRSLLKLSFKLAGSVERGGEQ